MDFKADFEKLRKTASEGLGQAKELAGGLAEKAVEAVQEKLGAVTAKTTVPAPVKSWNSTVAINMEGKNTMIRVPVELAELLGWKDKEIVTFALLDDGSVNLKKFSPEAKA